MSLSRSRLVTVLCLLATPPLGAQQATPKPLAADVVVTAEAEPAPAKDLAVAATVIDRAAIDRSRAGSLLELLRTVPGLDVVQSGGPGKVASLFLRGTNSTQTLVLVDGVKVSSAYFGGVDLVALPVSNVERIEVVRGPFSALWGSEAIGGVVQIFTRRATAPGFSGHGTLAVGNASTREGSLSASYVEGPVEATLGFRRATSDGDLPNDFFAVTNASLAVDVAASAAVRLGAVVRRDEGKSGIPYDGSRRSLHRETTHETTTLSVPVSVALGGTTIEAAALFSKDRPTLSDPEDPYGFTRADTDSSRTGARLTASRSFGPIRLSAGADWERTLVFNEDSYGLELDDLTTRTWSLFAEGRATLLDGRLVATLGVRRDEHDAFGGHTSPRVTVSYRPVAALKLRAAAGSAFRSPTTGELYYPFSGNAALQPERSTSFELGAELDAGHGVSLETTFFDNRITDLIQYDFTTSGNVNVGRARTRGAEAGVRAELGRGLFTRAAYTYLDAQDRDTGLALLRRPRHRGSLAVGGTLPWGGSFELTGLLVGARDDVDAITFARVRSASYLRVDLGVTGPKLLSHIAPWVRVTNLFGRDYQEVAGYPSPGTRFLAGLDVGF